MATTTNTTISINNVPFSVDAESLTTAIYDSFWKRPMNPAIMARIDTDDNEVSFWFGSDLSAGEYDVVVSGNFDVGDLGETGVEYDESTGEWIDTPENRTAARECGKWYTETYLRDIARDLEESDNVQYIASLTS